MYKVAVLLSTYNGEKYLCDQINSILNQTYENIELYIRDDASTDSTPYILKKYENIENVHIELSENNLGYPKCFFYLTESDIDADFYMFSDQDDVWFPEKVSMAVEKLSMEDKQKPVAYFSNYLICDEDLHVISNSKRISEKIKFENVLFEVCGLEFTMAINDAARKLLLKYKPCRANARGTWMNMLYAALGKIIYDDRVCAYYRRHSQAVSSSKMKGWQLWQWRATQFISKKGFSEYRLIMEEFYEIVGDQLSKKNKRFLENFISHKYFPWVILKVFYPKRLRSRLLDEIGLRIAFILNYL